jgi:hypothetical protein
MKRLCFISMFVLIVTVLFTGSTKAGLILQDQGPIGSQILASSPVGQSFTAEDPTVTIGFWLEDINPTSGPIDISIELFEGAGIGGPSLGIAPVEGLTPGFSGFYDADFTSVVLVPGQIYTAIVSSTSERGAVRSAQGNPYAGGMKLHQGSFLPDIDAAFRVTPQAVPAPDAIMHLAEDVSDLNLPKGTTNSLLAKLHEAYQKLIDGNDKNDVAAINKLEAFINAVEAQRGKKITEADADNLITQAQAIIDKLKTG